MRIKIIALVIVIVVVLLIVPFSVAAVTNTEIIAIMTEVINGVLKAGEQAYCAAGVTSLC